MSLDFTNSETMRSVVEIFESASREEQKRMLRVLRYEKARLLVRKSDRLKPRVKRTDKQIAEAVHRIRKSYGSK